MSAKLTSKYGGKRIKELAAMDGAQSVFVGVLKGSGPHPSGKGQRLVEIAWWNEFGTRTRDGKVKIPERPALRSTVIGHRYYRAEMIHALKEVLLGKSTTNKEFKLVGLVAETDIKEAYRVWSTPANAPSTQAEKGFNNPLIDTGSLRQAIAYRLERA